MDAKLDEIATLAIDLILRMSYLDVSPRLKYSSFLHDKFIKNLYTHLEENFQNALNNQECIVIGGHKHELEAFCVEVKNRLNINAKRNAKNQSNVSLSKVMSRFSLPNNGIKLQKIRRLELLAEKYIDAVGGIYEI